MTDMQKRLRCEFVEDYAVDDTHYGTFEDLCYERLMNDEFDELEELVVYDIYGM